MDPIRIADALQNALSLDVNHNGESVFIVNCPEEQLRVSLNSGEVQQRLTCSGYTLNPLNDGYDIFFNNKGIGKMFGIDKKPKFCDLEEDYEILFSSQIDETLITQSVSSPYFPANWISCFLCPHYLENYVTTEYISIADNDVNHLERNEKITYGLLPDMYDNVSQMDANSTLKHGKDYFESLRIRTEPFISDLKSHKYDMAKKMIDDFNIFLKNINGKLENEKEILDEINELKEEWDEVERIFDQMKQNDSESTKADIVISKAENPNITMPSNSSDEESNDVFEKEILSSKKHINEKHRSTVETWYERFIQELKRDQYEMAKEYRLIKLACLQEEVDSLWMKSSCHLDLPNFSSWPFTNSSILFILEKHGKSDSEGKSDSGSSSSSFSDSSKTSAPVFYEDILHALSNSYPLFEKNLPKFQKCSNAESLISIYVSILDKVVKNIQQKGVAHKLAMLSIIYSKPCEIYECSKREASLNKKNVLKMCLTSQKPAKKHRSLSDPSLLTRDPEAGFMLL